MERREFFTVMSGVLAGGISGLSAKEGDGSVPPLRKPSTALAVSTLGGGVIRIHQLQGNVVLLDFMTTGCPTCKSASAGIERVYRELGPKGFRPVAIALDVAQPAGLDGYRRALSLTFPLGTAPRGDVISYLEHSPMKPLYVPTLVLLDRRGNITSVEVGWRGEEALRASVLKLLSE